MDYDVRSGASIRAFATLLTQLLSLYSAQTGYVSAASAFSR
jgi:hypothetical protein